MYLFWSIRKMLVLQLAQLPVLSDAYVSASIFDVDEKSYQ